MASLAASALTNRYIYIYNPAWGVADATFGLGDDSTGDGSAAAPYATLTAAANEHLVAEGGSFMSAPMQYRFVSEDGESNDYGHQLYASAGTSVSTSSSTPCVFRGWKKSWGDVAKQGKWVSTTGDDKPSMGALIQGLAGAVTSMWHMHLKDIKFNQ